MTWELKGSVVDKHIDAVSDTAVMARWKCMTYKQEVGGMADVTAITNFKIVWYYTRTYDPNNYQWGFNETTASTTKAQGYYQSTFTVPDDAKKVKCLITPVCSLPSDNSWHWVAESGQTDLIVSPKETAAERARHAKPSTPTSPSASLEHGSREDYISVSCSCNAEYAKYVYVYRKHWNDASFRYVGRVTRTSDSQTTWEYEDRAVKDGEKFCYMFRSCLSDERTFSDDSQATSWVEMKPSAPLKPSVSTSAVAQDGSTGSVTLSWSTNGVTGSTTTIRYNDKNDVYDTDAQDVPVDYSTKRQTISGLSTAKTWYFWIKHSNSAGETSWSQVVSCLLATKPDPPAVSELLSSYLSGRPVTLSWQHSSADGADQAGWRVKVVVNGGTPTYITPGSGHEADQSCIVPLDYSDGTTVALYVQTLTFGSYDGPYCSNWSEKREFRVYAAPTIGIVLRDGTGSAIGTPVNLTALPLKVYVDAPSYSQGNAPVWFRIVVRANEAYTVAGLDGEEESVAEGQTLVDWSSDGTDADISGDFHIELGPEAMVFANGREYEVSAECSTESGLHIQLEPETFTVSIEGAIPNAVGSATWNPETMTATIKPACGIYDTGMSEPEYRDGVTLAVYRVANDGTTALVADGIENGPLAECVDPHADLGECVYRIVATETETGMKGWCDVVLSTPKGKACVLWDESVQYFDESGDPLPYTGKMLELAYNRVAVKKFGKEKAFVEHSGAKHPVVKRGTQRGDGIEVSFDIVSGSKADKLLEQLEEYDGNCYVRVPGFSGFTADAAVQQIERSYEHYMKIPTSVVFTHVDDRTASEAAGDGVKVVNS